MSISASSLAEQLHRMELFQSMPDPLLLKIAGKSVIIDLPIGSTVFEKNQPGNSLYMLLSGAVKVHDGEFIVAEIAAGSCFGELALLDAGPRSMSVTTTSPSTLARIDNTVFFDVVGDHPDILLRIVGVLTRRLRNQTNKTVEELSRKEEELTHLVEERTAELLRQKKEAEQLRRRAERSEKAEQQFLANMSHEIRTPMNAVMGMTKLLLQKQPREDQLRYLESIRQSSESLLVILNDILDISKIQAGRMELEWTNVNLADMLKSVRTTLQFRAEEKGLAFQVHIDPAISTALVCDPTRLYQVLLNLVGNAIKFTEKGSVDLFANCLEKNANRCRLHFEVRDTGIGMTPEQLAVVFESFKQASGDTTRKYGGTGLGLSISKQLVKLLGGKIEAESTPDKGSVFHVWLDLEIAKDQSAPAARPIQEMAATLRGTRILVVEDNDFNRIVAVETLEMLIPEVTVHTATNGLEGLKAVQNETFDVVLMDVSMPIMDGLEATRSIRALDGSVKLIPIIAFTASVTQKEVGRCLKAGMNACVPKPFEDAELIGALTAVLAGRKVATPAAPTLDLLAGTNPERLRKYLLLYLESAAEALPNIESALAAGKMEDLRRVVHTMKPQFKLLGMPETAELAQEIETQAVEGTDPASLPAKTERLLAAIRQSVSDFKSKLESV